MRKIIPAAVVATLVAALVAIPTFVGDGAPAPVATPTVTVTVTSTETITPTNTPTPTATSTTTPKEVHTHLATAPHKEPIKDVPPGIVASINTPVPTPTPVLPDLMVTITGSPDSVIRGQVITYVYRVQNIGLEDAGPFSLRITLPFESGGDSNSNFDSCGWDGLGLFLCEFKGSLATGEVVTATIRGGAYALCANGVVESFIHTTAQVDSLDQVRESNEGNNGATLSTDIAFSNGVVPYRYCG